MEHQSRLTYRPLFKVRPAPDGWYVVDCRNQRPGKIVAWFAHLGEAVSDARARSTGTAQA